MSLQEAWNCLECVGKFTFVAQSKAKKTTGWSGQGSGTIQRESINDSMLLFHEQGTWITEQGREFTFSNVFRWTANQDTNTLRLEHLRFGPKQPVYLFDLQETSAGVWESTEPHVCQTDLYMARMVMNSDKVEINWTVKGPEMNEEISYRYCG